MHVQSVQIPVFGATIVYSQAVVKILNRAEDPESPIHVHKRRHLTTPTEKGLNLHVQFSAEQLWHVQQCARSGAYNWQLANMGPVSCHSSPGVSGSSQQHPFFFRAVRGSPTQAWLAILFAPVLTLFTLMDVTFFSSVVCLLHTQQGLFIYGFSRHPLLVHILRKTVLSCVSAPLFVVTSTTVFA